jgi:hypothetical protein
MEPIDNNPFPNSWHPVHFHAQSGDVSGLATLLHENPDMTRLCNLQTADGKTPLMLAAEKGHVAMLHWLLDRGAVIDAAQPNTGYTALFVAVYQCQVAAVQTLLTRGSNVAHADRWGSTPWTAAGLSRHPATFLVLFEHLSKTIPRDELLKSCHIDDGGRKFPFLLHQVHHTNVDMVRTLLRLGANPYSDASANEAWEMAATAAAWGETGAKECLFLLEEWERAYVLAKVRATADAAGEARAGGRERGRQLPPWFREGMDVFIDGQEEEEEEKGEERKVGGVARWVVGVLADDLFRDLTEYVGERTTGLHVEVKEMAQEEVDEVSGNDDDDEAFDW